MNRNLLLIGGGDFAKKVIRLINTNTNYEIIGYTDINDGGSLFDVPYIGNDLDLIQLKNKYKVKLAVICIAGNIKIKFKREQLISKYIENGFSFPSIISKNAKIDSTVVYGSGVLVFDDAFVDFETNIGDYSVINLKVLICHHTEIGKNCVISPMTIVGGRTKIGKDCFIGINATVNPLITIADNIVIGSGSLVNKNLNIQGTYVGNPLKKIK
jgi:sugar O-acyltransferase (sialic acid O-acetyltransferase NeuD family)